MQLSSSPQIPDGLLAAMTLLSEKPRLGFERTETTVHQASIRLNYLNGNRVSSTVCWNVRQVSLMAQQTGSFTILGNSVPYTIAGMSAELATSVQQLLAQAVAIINSAQDLTPTQISQIQAVKAIHVFPLTIASSGTFSITNTQSQVAFAHAFGVNLGVGTMGVNASGMVQYSANLMSSTFVNEGSHIAHGDHFSLSTEERGARDQFLAAPALHVPPNEMPLIKRVCGTLCS